MKIRHLLLVLLALTVAMPANAANLSVSDSNDAATPVWYSKEQFYATSSWDSVSTAAALPTYQSGIGLLSNVYINDGSTTEYSESYHALNDITGSDIIVSYDFTLDRVMDDVGFRLLNGKKSVFGIVTKGTGLYLEQPNDELLYLCSYSNSLVYGAITYYVKGELDFKNQRINKIFINGECIAEDKPFANPESKADGFDITTGKESVGILRNTGVFIYGGYHIYETFWDSNGKTPLDWQVYPSRDSVSIRTFNSRNVDRYSLQMDSMASDVKYFKKIDPVSGHIIFEISELQPKKREGLRFAVMSGDNSVFDVTTNGNEFCYTDINGESVPFYDYMDNVWYVLKYDIDLDSSKVDLYLNNKLKQKDIPIKSIYNSVDGVEIFASKNDTELVIDDIAFYNKKETPADYVPEPQKPEKSDDVLIGMQMCPLWTQGKYHKSWDYVLNEYGRLPLMGAYDEGNPEVNDWQIKWMVDHGIDFQYICCYPNIPSSYNRELDPIKPNMLREGDALYNGLFNAKYSDMIKFVPMLENATMKDAAGTILYDTFFEHYVPYYIEYYLKDERCLKIDGRPVMGVLYAKQLVDMFYNVEGNGLESIQNGMNRLRQMCIDAGVGNPYILVSGSKDVLESEYQTYAQYGFDCITEYTLGYRGPKAVQEQNLAKIPLTEKYKIDSVGIAAAGLDPAPWDRDYGCWGTPEEFKESLYTLRDEFIPNISSSVSKKIIIADTWDEYAEGHWLAPTYEYGFAYLDAMRDVLTMSPSEHNDPEPTAQQRERINKLVVQDRKPNRVRVKKPSETIPNDAKLGWHFDNAADISAWSAEGDIQSINEKNGNMIVIPNGNNPTIKVVGLNEDVYDVTYIKLRMKRNSSSDGGYAYWTNNLNGDLDKNKKRVYFSPLTTSASEMTDYYIPVSSNVYWKGKVSELSINLGFISKFDEPFEIESIELLKDSELDKFKLSVDSNIYSLTPAPVIDDDNVMVPLNLVAEAAGATVGWHARENAYTVRKGTNISYIRVGDNFATVNNNVVKINRPAYSVSNTINDDVYVSIDFLALALDMNITWNNSEDTLYANSIIKAQPAENREVLKRYDFKSANDVASFAQMSSVTYGNGLSANSTGNDPQIYLKNVNDIDMSEVKAIKISINSSAASRMKFYFGTAEEPNLNEAKSSSFIPFSAGDNILTVKTSDINTWKGNLTKFRIDPLDTAGSFRIDYIAFLGDEVVTEDVVDMTSCVSVSDIEYCWNFDKNTMLDGWYANKSLADCSVDRGLYYAKIAGSMPAITTCSEIPHTADMISSIEISFKNATPSTSAKLYFITDDMKTWDEEHCFVFETKSNDSSERKYVINTSDNAVWTGKIKKMMFVPSDEKGSISIDYIKLNLNKTDKEGVE